ncbi:type 4 pilus major pilin [Comamonas composti]|uniref:type 4 pilus major pilin n=1 Tax=Comamonas composti TaxID=408558 RepID=UPI00040B650E|nr:type 4 pilus major pilin [Comamonas composti]
MKIQRQRISSLHQRGVTLTETLLVLALAAVMAAGAYRAYASASNDAKTSELGNGTVALIGKIKQVWGTDGNYVSLKPETLDRAGILPAQFRTNRDGSNPATEIRDTFGNTISVYGQSGSFTLGFENLSRDTCSTLATTLASLAFRIHVGAGARNSDGSIAPSGGRAYKGPTVTAISGLDTEALVMACDDATPANRLIVAEVR